MSSNAASLATDIPANHPAYAPFGGDWPILGSAPDIPSDILAGIKKATSCDFLQQHIDYFSLGFFFIDCSLLQPHHTQRQLNDAHIDNLVQGFQDHTIQRSSHPGVVIAVGKGWKDMFNNHKLPVKLSTTSQHLPLLRSSQNGPVGWIMHGFHRSEAVKKFGKTNGKPGEEYWLYRVLMPGRFYFYFLCLSMPHSRSLVVDTFSKLVLTDFCVIDNTSKPVLHNNMCRINSHLTELISFHYGFGIYSTEAKSIRNFLKRGDTQPGFRGLMKFPRAVECLNEVLKLGGVWEYQYDATYATLWKCRVEEVSILTLH
jgi:hypothetical protein